MRQRQVGVGRCRERWLERRTEAGLSRAMNARFETDASVIPVASGLTGCDSILGDNSGGKGDWTFQQLEAEWPVGRLLLFFRKEMRTQSRPVAKEINETRGEMSVMSSD